MATRASTITNPGTAFGTKSVSWTGLANGDDGTPFGFIDYAQRSIQIAGTFGAGGSVSLEGSNDGGTTWAIMKDLNGTAMTFTAAGLVAVGPIALLMRPHVTAGDGTTAIVATLVARRTNYQSA